MAEKYSFSDVILSAVILLIGCAEAANLYGAFAGGSLEECRIIFGVPALLSVGITALGGALLGRLAWKKGVRTPWTWADRILLGVFFVIFVTQLLYLFGGRSVYRSGDMTLETVGSFLESNGIYRVNPMTGKAYEAGMPNRIRILCLPALYAILSNIFSVEPGILVRQAVPVAALLCYYGAYHCLAWSLFGRHRQKRLCFLIAVAILLWVGSYCVGMDGFGILYAGWRGVDWRNAVLVPYVFSLCLRKKYGYALLCALAEACIAWTLYGFGVCLPIIAGMALADLVRKKMAERREVSQ